MALWLLKSEPNTYSIDDLRKDKTTTWDGIRNYAARLHLMAMQVGDQALFYHSGDDKAVVGVAEISRSAFPDPKVKKSDPEFKKGWLAVEVKAVAKLPRPVTLKEIKAHKLLQKMELVRQSRLSVSPVTEAQWQALVALASTAAPSMSKP